MRRGHSQRERGEGDEQRKEKGREGEGTTAHNLSRAVVTVMEEGVVKRRARGRLIRHGRSFSTHEAPSPRDHTAVSDER